MDTTPHSAPFYERFGFRTSRVQPDGYESGLDKHFMKWVSMAPPE